jgi:anti-sigma factor RsiW
MIDRRIEELLPFAASGSLPPEEQALVEEAAKSDPDVARELQALRAIGAAVKGAEAPASPGELGWARLQRNLRKSTVSGARTGAVWRWAAIAAGLVIVAETAALTAQTFRPRDDRLMTAGDSGQRRHAFIVQATFKPDAEEQDIRALLLEVRGTFADGPSALGVYKLSFRTQEEARAAEASLAARPDIVEFAQIE